MLLFPRNSVMGKLPSEGRDVLRNVMNVIWGRERKSKGFYL